MVEIFPAFSVGGELKIEMYALRVKSPDPPMPFIRFRPITWVELTFPDRSTSMAVFMEITPRRRTSSGWFEISCGRKRTRDLKNSRFAPNRRDISGPNVRAVVEAKE